MHFYEPGQYEEFVGKLSSISIKPVPRVWNAINKSLEETVAKKRRVFIQKLSVAASLAIILSLSVVFYLQNQIQVNPNILTDYNQQVNLQSNNSVEETLLNDLPNQEAASSILTKSVIIQNEVQINNTDIEVKEITHKPLIRINNPKKLKIKKEVPKHNQFLAYNNTTSQHNYFSHSEVQESTIEIESSQASSWSLVAFLNPTFSYHTTAALNYRLNPSETGAWMMGGEVLVRKELSDYFAVYSGVIFNPAGQNIKDLILLKNSEANGEMGFLFANTSFGMVTLDNNTVAISNFSNLTSAKDDILKSSSINTAELKQRFYYMEIPLIFSTSFRKGFVDVEIKLGCAAGVLIDNKFEVISRDGYFIGKTENIRPHNASALGAISLSIPFSNQLNLIVEPSARLSLYPLSYSYDATYPFAASVKVGMGYRF